MFRPESPRSRFGKPNFILGWIASVDSEISIIDLLGVDCRKRQEKESKQKRTNPVHKITPAASLIMPQSGYQLDAISHRSIPHRLYLAYRLVHGPRPRQLWLGRASCTRRQQAVLHQAERQASDRVWWRAIFLKTPGCWLCYWCCSNPGLRPLQGKALRFGQDIWNYLIHMGILQSRRLPVQP
jgi:hypothetical protein